MMHTIRFALLIAALGLLFTGATLRAPAPATLIPSEDPSRDAGSRVLDVELSDRAFGRSGALQVRVTRPGELVSLGLEWPSQRPTNARYRWVPVLGTATAPAPQPLPAPGSMSAPSTPGVYELELVSGSGSRRFGAALRLVVTVPFEEKENGYIGEYLLGHWPTEGDGRTDRYAPPAGFMQVTKENQSLRLSEHFQLREFLTHDQKGVWPKYVVVDPRLLDKLELVLTELEAGGVRADHMVVMSGFRTPQYNRKGLGSGRASLSRHQFGDAADVWVDSDGDWYMDDLNRDGRRDTRDARVMLDAVNRVESDHPDLVGGAGVYPDNGAHGPFIHIDARGTRARW